MSIFSTIKKHRPIKNRMLNKGKKNMERDKEKEKFTSFIRHIAKEIKALEEQAQSSLAAAGDKETYHKKHLKKTLLLISLPDKTAPFLSSLDPTLRSFVEKGISEFAEDAKMAQKVNSIFYMSVLLAPDENTTNDTGNAFDHFVRKIEQMLA